jgi:Zn finger protein HypA/HybF involved in hydrogenase expression
MNQSRRRTASRKLRDVVLKKQRHACFDCKNVNPNLEIDHIIPYAVGGLTELKNLQALCPNCHAQKSRNSNEGEKIRRAKQLKMARCELCWSCEKIVSPYFFKNGTCNECKTKTMSSWEDEVWIIPCSPLTD